MSDDDSRVDGMLRQWGEQQRRLADQSAADVEQAAPQTSSRPRWSLGGAAAAAVLLVAGVVVALRGSSELADRQDC